MATVVSHSSSHICLLFRNQTQLLWLLNCGRPSSRSAASKNFLFALGSAAESRPSLHLCRSTPWDSDAEPQTTKRFSVVGDDEYEEDNENGVEQWLNVLEDYIDSIWIFKVFGSFGLMFPAILISMLLATGPKAFLLALALPIGQSTFTFAFQKMQESDKKKPKLEIKNTKKGRSHGQSSKNANLEQEQTEWVGNQDARYKNKGYQSWVSKNKVSIGIDDRSLANFGGWDELDEGVMGSYVQSSRRRPSPKLSRLQGTPATKKGKSNRRWSERDLPSLLRLLISLFPFLEFLDKT